jgi:hypothetical protein
VNDALEWASGRLVKGRLIASSTTDNVQLSFNRKADGFQDDGTKPGWLVSFGPSADTFNIMRAPAGNLTASAVLIIDGSGHLYSTGTISTGGTTSVPYAPGVRITGTAAGIRCQGVGTAAPDGFSNPIAFGWDGALKARVDSTVIGTVTVTSDARVKLDVLDDVPGLDAVRALRPISFEYDQTKRTIGFPAGRHYGLIAQDVQPYAPLVVEADDSDEHWLEIDYRLLVPVLIRAIQELTQKVEATAA